MAGSTLTGFNYIPENSEATPGLWNSVFSVLSQNLAEANSIGNLVSNVSTVGMVTINANSNVTDYIHFHDSSNQRSDYIIGSNAGGTSDGLNIYDASGATLIVSFSKQSVRFYQQVIGPVFDLGGALTGTYNAKVFQTGSASTESAIQAAINQAALDGVPRVYVPSSMYPYSASSISFIHTLQMTREGGDSSVFDVFAYGGNGNGVVDDLSAISAGEAARANHGGELYFPKPSVNYTVSDYIIGSPGMMWTGQGSGGGATPATRIIATGVGKGIIQWRAGSNGGIDPISGQRGMYLRDLELQGNATSGHIINLARVSMFRADQCAFSSSRGTGLKDDQTTAIAAAGIYMFGVEHVNLKSCLFESNTNLAGGGGAGINAEREVHMISIENGQFNTNTYHIRFGSGGANVVWHIHGGTNFQAGACVLKADSGGNQAITFDTCWAENQTDTAGAILQLSGGGSNNVNFTIENCLFNTSTVDTLVCFQGALSLSRFANNKLNGQWHQAFSTSANLGGNVEEGTYAPTTTQMWALNSPSLGGFTRTSVSDGGGISADNGDASYTINWGYDQPVQLWNTPLTQARTASMQIQASFNGQRQRIVRGASATGAFNLTVQDTTPTTIIVLPTAGTWADVMWNGTAWTLVAYGSLVNTYSV